MQRQPDYSAEVDRDELERNPEGVPIFKYDRVVDPDPMAEPTSAEDTLTGATSADVIQGLNHPGAGETSNELRHDGQRGRKKYGAGAEQWGTTRKQDLKVRPDERQRDFDIDKAQ